MMNSPLFLALASGVLVSLVSLVSVITLVLRRDSLGRVTFLLVSLAVGALFGDAVIHLLPAVFQNSEGRLGSSLWILFGIFFSFVFEKFLRWKHEHGVPHHSHIKPVGRILLVSDGLHNFVDGVLVGASYMTSRQVGVATTIAVILHEVPHEIGDFGVLIDAGYSWEKAMLFNFLTGCIAIAGVLAAFVFQAGTSSFSPVVLPITAGSFLYIAGSNLTPELQKEGAPLKSLLQFVAMMMGVGLMLLLLRLE
jgi:zinc and cadmium transporter